MEASSKKDLAEVGEIIRSAKALAKRYRSCTGRPLGITGEVAEYEAARLLGLELAPVRQAGFDLIRRDGNKVDRLQVKGRWILSSNPGQRLGAIKLDKGGTACCWCCSTQIWSRPRYGRRAGWKSRPPSKDRDRRRATSVAH